MHNITMNLFENCSQHYSIESYFVNCTNTTRQCELIQDLSRVSLLLTIFDYYIAVVLFAIAAILNIYCLSITIPLYLQMNSIQKKRYVFVISRAISAILAALTLLILRCILLRYVYPCQATYIYYAIIVITDNFSFYSLQGAYIGMSALLYIGVMHPRFYSQYLSLNKIYFLSLINWLISAIISIPCGLFQAATYCPGSFIQCDPYHCAPILTLVNFILVSIAFILTIIILSYVLIVIYWHLRKGKKTGSVTGSNSLRSARMRLSWTLFAIIFISLAEGIPSSFLLGLKADTMLSTCNNFYQADKLISVTIMTSLDSIIWAIVLLIDPIANIFYDEHVKNEVKRQIEKMELYYAKILEWVYH